MDNVVRSKTPFYGNEKEVHLLRNNKMEQGFFNFVYHPVRLKNEEVEKDYEEIIQEKNALLEINVMCEAPVIIFQFRQLMQNLIGNSLKFVHPDNRPRIRIKCEISKGSFLNNEKLLPEKNYCHVTVSDNGIGFQPEFKDKIFELFQRLHGKNDYPGTGIGLAIVKKIVENHNGIITATSGMNEGATFDIYLPV